MARIGLFSGLVIGIAGGYAATGGGGGGFESLMLLVIPLFGLIGLAGGAIAGGEETIQIEGKSETKIKEALEKLRKKARIPDYQ